MQRLTWSFLVRRQGRSRASASPAKVSEMLKVLATLGQARLAEDGRYHG